MSNSEKKTPAPKKPYHPPTLENYGAVRDLTRNVAGNGRNDSMSSNSTKTG
jgi:hypothetical protein